MSSQENRLARFQSTLPCGERHNPFSPKSGLPCSFNPRSRVGSDGVGVDVDDDFVRFNPRSRVGSDGGDGCLLLLFGVSIHAPVWGATAKAGCTWRILPCFNPRSRVGSDRWDAPQRYSPRVSIHAPVWGATRWATSWPTATASFNPRSPCGERPDQTDTVNYPDGFNPRSRVGSDEDEVGGGTALIVVSIHAPVWGATDTFKSLGLGVGVSIHAPVWGATPAVGGTEPARHPVSIHAPVWGATTAQGAGKDCVHEFQSTLPCGERRR